MNNLHVTDLSDLWAALMRPSSLLELLVLASLLLFSWGVVRWWGRAELTRQQHSIWFGSHWIDGVLFPVLSLVSTYAAMRVFLDSGRSVAVLKVAVPVLMSLVVIRLTVRVLSAAFPASVWMRAIERTVSWLAWLGVVLWVTGLLPILLKELEDIQWKLGNHPVSLRTLLEGALSAGFVMVVALWISAALEARLLAGATGAQLSLRKVAANMLRAVLLFTGLLMSLSAVGIDLTALSVLGGALGVGIGFGLQKLAANYVSGFVILAERALRIGDVVKVGQFEGTITDITTRYTVIRAPTGREAIVPNETLITTTVESLSLADTNLLQTTVITVGYDTDIEALIAPLVDVVQAVPRVLADPSPAVQLASFAADGLELRIHFWIADPENGLGNVRSAVNLAVLALLRKERIEIPFPQRVLHSAPQPTPHSS